MHPRTSGARHVSLLFTLFVMLCAPARGEEAARGMNTYASKGCAQIGDTVVCGAAEIAAAVAAALAAERAAAEAAKAKPAQCFCICGLGDRKLPLKRMPEYECRALCVLEHGFVYGDYSCK